MSSRRARIVKASRVRRQPVGIITGPDWMTESEARQFATNFLRNRRRA